MTDDQVRQVEDLGETAGRYLRLAIDASNNDGQRVANSNVSVAASLAALVHLYEAALEDEEPFVPTLGPDAPGLGA